MAELLEFAVVTLDALNHGQLKDFGLCCIQETRHPTNAIFRFWRETHESVARLPIL
jgi:hypothetical protein